MVGFYCFYFNEYCFLLLFRVKKEGTAIRGLFRLKGDNVWPVIDKLPMNLYAILNPLSEGENQCDAGSKSDHQICYQIAVIACLRNRIGERSTMCILNAAFHHFSFLFFTRLIRNSFLAFCKAVFFCIGSGL